MSLETAVNNAVAELATTNTNMTAVLTEVQGQKDSLDQKVTQAGAAATSAQSAEAGAVAAQTASESARDASVTARDAAVVAQGAAEAARADTLSDVSAAEAARVLAENARSGAQSAEAGALAAQTGAETAQSAVEAIESTIGVSIASAEASAAQAASAVSSVEVSRAAAEAAETAASGHALSAGEHADRAETAEANAFAIADSDIASALTSCGITNVADVFVYDTSKDDYPDWIHKATWQSWYGEARPTGSWLGSHASAGAAVAANPGAQVGDYYWHDGSVQELREIVDLSGPTGSTVWRGSKARFPRVAIVVACSGGANDKVIILDADDPALPVWMVFDADAGGATADSNLAWDGGASQVIAKNGRLLVDSETTVTTYVDFVRDTGGSLPYRFVYSGNVAERNARKGFRATGVSEALASDTVNDLDMWVDPLAPIDPATCMRRPVIACATAGGISVIQEDGTVTSSASGAGANGVAFLEDGTLAWRSGYSVFHASPAAWRGDSFAHKNEVYGGPGGNVGAGATQIGAAKGARYLTTARGPAALNAGIAVFDVRADGARMTQNAVDFALPPFKRDALALAISSTEIADLVGATPLDEDFDGLADTAALDAAGFIDTSTGAAVTDLDTSGADQRIRLNAGTSSGDEARRFIDVTTEVGATYAVEWPVSGPSGIVQLRGIPGGTKQKNPSVAADVDRIDTFVADSTTTPVRFYVVLTDGVDRFVDSVRIRRVEPDRSGNGNDPVAAGTFRRRPLDGNGGVSALQGFQAPQVASGTYGLKASLPSIGTGDFCLSSTVFIPDGSYASFMGSESSPGVENFRAEIAADGNLRTSIGGVLEIHGPIPTDSPVAITLLRRSGVVEVWVNGFLLDSIANSTSLDWSVEPLWIVGHPSRGHSTDVVMGGLAHYETVAPTAEEVKEKHRVMLAWAKGDPTILSDTVDALDYDSETDELFVSGPSGTTVLHGSTLTRARTHTSADAHLSTNDHNAVAASGGVSALASSSKVRLSLPALALRDRLLSTRSSPAVPPAIQRAATTDATPTPVSAVPIGEGEVRTFEITSRAHEAGDPTSSSEAAQYRCTFTARRPVGGDVELVGTPPVAVDYESTSSMDLSITANTADGLIEAVATGVAGSDLVWATQLKEIAR